jgi:hypothetical protein
MVKLRYRWPDTSKGRREMMSKRPVRQRISERKPKPLLVLKVSGPEIRTGRIPVPDLLVVCQHAQSAVSRQAEAIEGRKQTLHRGPKLGKVVQECTLDLVALDKGSAVLAFEQSKAQAAFPQMPTLAVDAVAKVGEGLQSLSKGRAIQIDPGVLDSLRSMGEVFGNGVRSIEWIVPAQAGRKRIAATFNKRVRNRVAERLRPPVERPETVEGLLEMADFKPADQKCRVHPSFGLSVTCTFAQDVADDVYALLRQPVRVEGKATINAQTQRIEEIAITKVTALAPPNVSAGSFLRGWTFDQLAHVQGVEPLRDVSVLASGLPDDEDDLDAVLTEIYDHRN